MYSFIVAATCLVGVTLAQTPPSYTLAETNNTLGLKYGNVNVIAGEVLGYEVPSHEPQLSSSIPLNSTYIAILVDTIANISSTIPADLLWFQQNVTFSSNGIASYDGSSAQVPYLAPSSVGHPYLALLYTQPPNFIIPSNFPYNDTFRVAFNVSRVSADFQTPLLEANYFLLGSNCTYESKSKAGPYSSGTAGHYGPTATGSYHRPSSTGIYNGPAFTSGSSRTKAPFPRFGARY